MADRLMHRSGLIVATMLVCNLAGVAAFAAGNVEVTLKNGKLLIRGDNESNTIGITTDSSGADLTISGAPGTTVNGGDSIGVTGLTGNVVIAMRGGDDVVTIGETIDFPKNLIITTGDGDDTLAFTDTRALGDISVSTGAGDDDVESEVLKAGGKVKIAVGQGANTVTCLDAVGGPGGTKVSGGGDREVVFVSADVEGKLVITTADGNDSVTLDGTFGDDVAVNLGKGDDDVTTVDNLYATDLTLNGGPGTDTLSESNDLIGGKLTQKNFEIFP